MKATALPIPPKGLLAAVDLSTVSLAAWQQALRLSSALGTPVEAVFVNEQHPSATVGGRRFDLTAALRRQVVRDIHDKLGRRVPVHVLEGDAASALRDFLGDRPGRWLVMGTHGRRGLRRFVLGSVAEALVVLPRMPILTVQKRPRDIRSILVPVTADPESLHDFQFAAELAWRLRARLTPIHVAQNREEKDEAAALAVRLRARLPAALSAHCSKALIASGRTERAVVATAARHDLVVLRADRAVNVREVFTGGATAHVLRLCPVPVLVLPADVSSRASVWKRRFPAAYR